ncbi:hypothetical protein EYZ11_005465 [Aspergillus tanneri]|uniref:DUF4246 domain-containing protein n=1 Tax=Aspergillus tanneri TaxID=1220188 RepID=A0A4S3JIH8_9EURO|nr:hypothetical protein EYZ11_005465 [Aspergillus tanneri]
MGERLSDKTSGTGRIHTTKSQRDQVDLHKQFAQKGLQVIFKLANIELAPEKPDYEGGIWHVEGQMNEHICATTLCYYDSENITENNLSFRQRAETDPNNILYPQGRHEFLYKVFGFGPDIDSNGETHITQHLGSVSTHEGRLLAFPNILQHRVSPFSLADRSKPGLLELQQTVNKDMEESITMDEAKRFRLELREERKGATSEQNGLFEIRNFSLCEH